MSPAEIAHRLRLEREFLESLTEPLHPAGIRALCARLADMEGSILRPADSPQLVSRQLSDTFELMHAMSRNEVSASRLARSSPELEAVIGTGWSISRTAKALTADGYKISGTHLGNLLRGEKGVLTPEVRRMIRKITGAKL